MRSRLAAALFHLSVAPALAQTPPPAPPPSNPVPIPITGHDCESPEKGMNIAPMLAFTVKADGTVGNLSLLQSTGTSTVDRAGLACAAKWTFKPAIQGGVPMAMAWKAVPNWSPFFLQPVNAGSKPCNTPPADASVTTHRATVRYAIETDGHVTVEALTASSNNAAFDTYLRSCAQAWRFTEPEGLYPVRVVDEYSVWPEQIVQPGPATGTIPAKAPVHPPVKPVNTPATPPAPSGMTHECLAYYPALAVRLAHEGRTVVDFRIAPDGTVNDLAVRASSGHPELDEAAMDCAVNWTYRPAMLDGHPIEMPWRTMIAWSLQKASPAPATAPVK
ncbi:MAG TPA: energy transducer TonB [Rhizomicrobium sp.]